MPGGTFTFCPGLFDVKRYASFDDIDKEEDIGFASFTRTWDILLINMAKYCECSRCGQGMMHVLTDPQRSHQLSIRCRGLSYHR